MDNRQKTIKLLSKWHLSGFPAFDAPKLDSGGPYRDVTGSPLLVLKSVSLMGDAGYDNLCDMLYRLPSSVYGRVLMIDDLGDEFHIFGRQRQDAKELVLDTIPLDPSCFWEWKLPLLNQCDFGTPRCFPKSFTLHIFLMGVFKDADYLLVDARLTTTFDSPQLPCNKDYFHYTLRGVSHCTGPLEGIMDLCAVDYEIFRHALVLDVSISLVGDDDADADAASSGVVFGSITAKNQDGHVPSCLLDAEFEKPQKLEFGVKTKLSTLAIPSSSVISIQVNLEVHNNREDTDMVHNWEDLCGSYLYEPNENVGAPLAFVFSGTRFKVIVFVCCAHAMRVLPEYELREWCYPKRLCRAKPELEKWLDSDIERYYHHCIKFDDSNASDGYLDASSKRSSKTKRKENITHKLRFVRPLYWYVSKGPLMPEEMVELFCITVHWNNSGEPVSKPICGEIKFCFLPGESITIFYGEASVSPGKPIQLCYPSECIRGRVFQIEVNLKDSQGSEISYGSVICNAFNAECCYNRRTCSIIKGQCGYAALYYTLFSDAIQAKLKFTLESKSNKSNVGDDDDADADADFRVCGKIIARYNNFMYCTTYDEDYYQSVLFQKDSREAVSVGNDGGIPLSKCVVAVPLIASLLVQACIFVKIEGADVQTLKIKAHFNPKKPEEKLIKTRHGSNYCSFVSVEWSK